MYLYCPMLLSGGTAEFVHHSALSIVSSVFMSVKFLWFHGLPPREFLGCGFWYFGYGL
jgi:hypothetical protein